MPAESHAPGHLLHVDDLEVSFPTAGGTVPAVRGLSFHIAPGEALGLVGESGSGKSAAALALLGLTPPPGLARAARIDFGGRPVCGPGWSELPRLRATEIGMVFQDPMTSLDPVFTVGHHLAEALCAEQRRKSRKELRARSVELLGEVGVPDPESRLGAYPGELSGGLRQRVMIAMALACRPRLLIADEPTTALDVTIQAQVMALLDSLRRLRGMALLLITHDLGLIAQHADRVVVLYAGRVVEEAPTASLFRRPLHPYTRGLLRSLPGAVRRRRLETIPGNVPHPSRVPAGCPFRDRCREASARCAAAVPPLEERESGRSVRCVEVGPLA